MTIGAFKVAEGASELPLFATLEKSVSRLGASVISTVGIMTDDIVGVGLLALFDVGSEGTLVIFDSDDVIAGSMAVLNALVVVSETDGRWVCGGPRGSVGKFVTSKVEGAFVIPTDGPSPSTVGWYVISAKLVGASESMLGETVKFGDVPDGTCDEFEVMLGVVRN